MCYQRIMAVYEFMKVGPTWESFAPYVAALNEEEFYILRWHMNNDIQRAGLKSLRDHENPLASRLADFEHGHLDQEFGHLIGRFDGHRGLQEDKGKPVDKGKSIDKENEKDAHELDAETEDDEAQNQDEASSSSQNPKRRNGQNRAARQSRSDWGQERTKMTEDEVRIVQPDYDTIGRPSHKKMARHKTFLRGGEGDRKGIGMVELTDTEFRNLVRYRIANRIHLPERRPRDDPTEQASWDEAARKRSKKLEDVLDAARKAKGVSKEERERLLADWEGPTEYPEGERDERLRTVASLGVDVLASGVQKP